MADALVNGDTVTLQARVVATNEPLALAMCLSAPAYAPRLYRVPQYAQRGNPMDDTQLLLHLATLTGREVIERMGSRPRQWYEDSANYPYLRETNGGILIWTSLRSEGRLWRPFDSLDDALLIMRHFEAAGCSAWVGCDGHTGRRGGVTTSAGRFEAEAETEARAFCLAALKSRGIEVPDAERS